MFKFDLGEEVKISNLHWGHPNVYRIGKTVKVIRRDFVQQFDKEPIYWFGNKRCISKIGLSESHLEKI